MRPPNDNVLLGPLLSEMDMYKAHQEQCILKILRVLIVSTSSGHQKRLREEPHLDLPLLYPGAAVGREACGSSQHLESSEIGEKGRIDSHFSNSEIPSYEKRKYCGF